MEARSRLLNRTEGVDPFTRALALVFAELAGRKLEWKQALEGWNVRRIDWSSPSGSMDVKGRLEMRRASLPGVLQARFRVPIPGDLTSAIQADHRLQRNWTRWLDNRRHGGFPRYLR